MACAVSVTLYSSFLFGGKASVIPRNLAVALFCTFAALICLQDCIRFINLLPIYTRSHLKTLPRVVRNIWWHVLFYTLHGVLWVVLFALPFLTVSCAHMQDVDIPPLLLHCSMPPFLSGRVVISLMCVRAYLFNIQIKSYGMPRFRTSN